MKTKEELNALKEEVETLNSKLAELTDDELKEVVGGAGDPDEYNSYYTYTYSCPVCHRTHSMKAAFRLAGYFPYWNDGCCDFTVGCDLDVPSGSRDGDLVFSTGQRIPIHLVSVTNGDYTVYLD